MLDVESPDLARSLKTKVRREMRTLLHALMGILIAFAVYSDGVNQTISASYLLVRTVQGKGASRSRGT